MKYGVRAAPELRKKRNMQSYDIIMKAWWVSFRHPTGSIKEGEVES